MCLICGMLGLKENHRRYPFAHFDILTKNTIDHSGMAYASFPSLPIEKSGKVCNL